MTTCVACGGTMRPWRAAHSSDPGLATEAFSLDLCERCGTARTVGQMPAVEEAHETSYYAAPAKATNRFIEPLRRLAEADKLRSVGEIGAGDEVLEIGSGDGRFLARLRSRGAEAVGVEPSPQARGRAASVGAPTIAATVEEVEREPGSLDALISWHSLEHLERPDLVMERASGWVRPGGLVVVAVPNRASLQARIGGDRWFHQDVPRHRTHFTAKGVTTLLERSGFAIERVRHVVAEQNPLGMWISILNRVTKGRDVAYRALKRDPTLSDGPKSDLVLTALLGIPLIPVAIVLELAAGLARRGGSVVVMARAR